MFILVTTTNTIEEYHGVVSGEALHINLSFLKKN